MGHLSAMGHVDVVMGHRSAGIKRCSAVRWGIAVLIPSLHQLSTLDPSPRPNPIPGHSLNLNPDPNPIPIPNPNPIFALDRSLLSSAGYFRASHGHPVTSAESIPE